MLCSPGYTVNEEYQEVVNIQIEAAHLFKEILKIKGNSVGRHSGNFGNLGTEYSFYNKNSRKRISFSYFKALIINT
jgi:hypothetical protein